MHYCSACDDRRVTFGLPPRGMYTSLSRPPFSEAHYNIQSLSSYILPLLVTKNDSGIKVRVNREEPLVLSLLL
jgi:hypothetical protein